MINLNGKKGISQIENFVNVLSKLNPLELCAAAKMLGVALTADNLDTQKPEMRDGQDIVHDMVAAYSALNRHQRRNLMAILGDAAS